jgi:hypothetical protein
VPLPPENLAHPCFPQPADPTVRVWRYVDFAKLVWALTQGALVLTRIDTLTDKREGRHGRHLRPAVVLSTLRQMEMLKQPLDPAERRRLANQIGDMAQANEELHRTVSYASCWCQNGEKESEAMWRIYAGGGLSVALVLPYERLRDSLDRPDLYIGTVTYFDFNRGLVPADNVYRPTMYKGREFEYEKEVRIVKHDHTLWETGDPPTGLRPRSDRSPVVTVPWSIATHVERIVVSPYAAVWQTEALRAALARLSAGLEARVVASEMT